MRGSKAEIRGEERLRALAMTVLDAISPRQNDLGKLLINADLCIFINTYA
jgi:hypothetical protein